MSFLGGAECSTASNPLSQFTKHVQDDHSLQRDRLTSQGPSGLQESFRNFQISPAADEVRSAGWPLKAGVSIRSSNVSRLCKRLYKVQASKAVMERQPQMRPLRNYIGICRGWRTECRWKIRLRRLQRDGQQNTSHRYLQTRPCNRLLQPHQVETSTPD